MTGLTFVVGLSTSYAAAVNSCNTLFTRTAREESFQRVRELNNRFYDFKDNSEDLQVWIRETEAITEEYFNRAQITVEKIKNFSTHKVGDRIYENLESHVYEIRAGSSVDPNARMIQGFYQKAQDPRARIIYDPFLTLWQDHTMGYYEADSRHIHVSALALAAHEVHLDFNLNHEISHYFEHMKILKGQRTLARFDLSCGNKIKDDLYSDHASLDELETHIRDIRLLKDLSTPQKEFLIANGTPAESFELFQSYRQENIASKLKVIQDLAGKALETLEEIKTMRPVSSALNKDHQLVVKFEPQKTHYKEVTVELTGIDFTNRDYKKIAHQQLANEIEFAENRIDEILNEALRYYLRNNAP